MGKNGAKFIWLQKPYKSEFRSTNWKYPIAKTDMTENSGVSSLLMETCDHYLNIGNC